MLFYSTNKKSPAVSFRQALLSGLAPDGGLYMPKKIPRLPRSFFDSLSELTFCEIAFEISKKFIGSEVSDKELKKTISESFNFPVPLREVDKNTFILELFHGPTLAFKDFGARFMAQLMASFAKKENRRLTVLVATSGDTGSAVAAAFLDIPDIKVVVLYPSKRISLIQEKQISTLGKNILALEIQGNFDDCQKLVKTAFQDKELGERIILTSANSINIGRLIPQSFYYFYAFSRLKFPGKPVISVPSGNFGNLTAGILAQKMGLPISRFIAATNINDVVPQYLKTGKFISRPSKSTISSAMDVGSPSNFARILDIFDNGVVKMRKAIFGVSVSELETKEAIKEVYKSCHYVMDPHTAVGYSGWRKYQKQNRSESEQGIILSTAHPAKFKDVLEPIINKRVQLPPELKQCFKKPKRSIVLPADFKIFKDFLLN